jgi:hypothetical protein
MELIQPLFGFILVFAIIALLKLLMNFLRALLSDPPKPFELTERENVIYGLFISYIITYIIFF